MLLRSLRRRSSPPRSSWRAGGGTWDLAKLRRRVESTLAHYGGPDPVPAAAAASAVCAIRKADKDEAMRVAEENLARHPAAADLRAREPRRHPTRHYRKAIAELDRVIEREPDHERALLWRCRSMRRLGQWSDLERYLDEKVSEFAQSARLRIELGWLRLAQGESRKRTKPSRRRPGLTEAPSRLSSGGLSRCGRCSAGRRPRPCLRAGTSSGPRAAGQRLAAAMLALDREDFDQAAKLFDQVDGVSGLLGQASVLVQQRRLTEASGKLEEARGKETATGRVQR